MPLTKKLKYALPLLSPHELFNRVKFSGGSTSFMLEGRSGEFILSLLSKVKLT